MGLLEPWPCGLPEIFIVAHRRKWALFILHPATQAQRPRLDDRFAAELRLVQHRGPMCAMVETPDIRPSPSTRTLRYPHITPYKEFDHGSCRSERLSRGKQASPCPGRPKLDCRTSSQAYLKSSLHPETKP